jgi:hypothetical protein
MRIEWKITKKRGNMRPVLSYRVRLEDHEKALALPMVSIVSTIPRPEEDAQEHCYPGRLERSPEPVYAGVHTLEAPSHLGHSWTRTLRLPWREDNEYPEIEDSFLLLREALEKELDAACRSTPMQTQGMVGTSDRAKVGMAPALLAERFLRAAGKSAAV